MKPITGISAPKREHRRGSTIVEHNIPVNATPMFCSQLDAGLGGEALFEFMEREHVHDASSLSALPPVSGF
jgi:hypothetical protein